MRSRILFGGLGGLIGLATGLVVSLVVVAVVAGTLWIFVFGDNPWPPGANPVLGAIALIIIIFLVIAGTWIGLSYGRRLDSLPQREGGRKKWIAAISALCVLALLASFLLLVVHRSSVQTATTQLQEADFERLAQRAQRIVSVSPRIDGAALRMTIVTEGASGGPYQLDLDLSRPGGRRLLSHRETWVFMPGRNDRDVMLAATEVVDAYRATAFTSGAVGLILTEEEMLSVTLQPVPSEDEAKTLSTSEVQNLRLGTSRLTDRKTVHLPVTLTISKSGEAMLH